MLYNILVSQAKEPHRVKSGIQFVDKLTGGGFIVPGTYLITGDSNAGKTTLTAQIADGITSQGNIALFSSLEMIESHLSQVLLKRLDLKHGFIVSFEKDSTQLIIDWKKLVEDNPDKKVVLIIDSLQNLARGETVLECLLRFQKRAEQFGSNVIFIGQATKGGEYRGSAQLQHEVSCHIHLSVVSNDVQQVRKVEVRKNRAGQCETTYTELGERGHKEVDVDEDGEVV